MSIAWYLDRDGLWVTFRTKSKIFDGAEDKKWQKLREANQIDKRQ